MNMSLQLFLFIFYAIAQIRAFKNSELQVIKSVSDQLNRKQIIIIRKLWKDVNYKEFLNSLKYFSNYGIYTVFHTTNEMRSVLLNLVSYGYPDYKFNQRAMAVLSADDLQEMAKLYFNVNFDVVVAKIPWIIFHNSNEKIMEKLYGSYIPYHCQFLLVNSSDAINYNLDEIYKIYPNHTIFQFARFGTYNKKNGLIIPVNDFYGRRFNLTGYYFGIQTSCWVVKNGNVCPFNELNVFEEIVITVAEKMNFGYQFVYQNDEFSFSNFLKNHPDSRVEFSLSFVYTLDSSDYHPSKIPVWKFRGYLHVKYIKDYEKGMSSPFVRPFTNDLWYSVGAWILGSTLFIVTLNYVVNRYEKSSLIFDQLLDSFFISFESFTTQCGGGTPPEAGSYRIATFAIQIPPLFLVLAYSSIIISFITIRIIHLPFHNLDGFIEDGTFKLGYIRNSFPKDWFQNTQDPTAKLAHEKFAIDEEEMPGYMEGLAEKICEDPKFSAIQFDDYLFEFTFDCFFLQIPSPLFTTNAALGVREFSPFKNIFSRMINLMRSCGIINAVRKRVFYVDAKTGLLAKNTKEFLTTRSFEIDTVDWDAVESIYVLLGIAYLISIIILLFETCIFQKLSKKKKISKEKHEYKYSVKSKRSNP